MGSPQRSRSPLAGVDGLDVCVGGYVEPMAYSATVLRVAIASPADVADARDAVEQALRSWNDAHGERRGVSLQPWRWETGAVPVLGDTPQALINSQGMDRADILISLFGSRLGSPTPSAVSGTVEEIERAVEADKPVHLYFSTAPLPHDVDTRQLDGLRQFRQAIQERGLYGEYHNVTELGVEVWKAIEHDLARFDLDAPALTSLTTSPVAFRVQTRQSGHDHFLDITNRSSTTDADNVTITQRGDWAGKILTDWDGPTTIHAEQTRSAHLVLFFGVGTDQRAIDIAWDSDGEHHVKTFYF